MGTNLQAAIQVPATKVSLFAVLAILRSLLKSMFRVETTTKKNH